MIVERDRCPAAGSDALTKRLLVDFLRPFIESLIGFFQFRLLRSQTLLGLRQRLSSLFQFLVRLAQLFLLSLHFFSVLLGLIQEILNSDQDRFKVRAGQGLFTAVSRR